MTAPRRALWPALLLAVTGCARGKSGETEPPVGPPPGPTPFVPLAGLVRVAAGTGEVRADFIPPPDPGFEAAVFVSTVRSGVFSGPAQVPAPGATSLILTGLVDGTEYYLGLGVRPVGGGTYEPSGPVLTSIPGSPFYVDEAAAPGGDGGSPATAFNDLFTAMLFAFARLNADPGRGVNVWVKEGSYTISSTLPVTGGVSIQGGFSSAFDLATRDPAATPTVWNVAAGEKAIEYGDQVDNSLPVIVDGVRISGNDAGRIAVDTDQTNPSDIELRDVVITDMADRGLRFRNVLDEGFDVVLSAVQSSRNGADGLSGSGAFDYRIHGSVFAENVQEGVDLDGLVPETGGIATLELTGSQFFRNQAEGLDCTLKTLLVPTTGHFSVRIRGCSFEGNALAGCLVDADFETSVGYGAGILVRESIARANSGPGFHLDLDAPVGDPNEQVTGSMHRVLATANAEDGLLVTSESRPGLLVVSASAMIGNAGAGMRAVGPPALPGNRAVVLTNCVLAGNFGGGMISRDAPGSAVSTIASRQASPFGATVLEAGTVVADDAGFVAAPEEYLRVLGRSGAVLTLASAPAFPLTAVLELDDDTVPRAAISSTGTTVTLSQSPEASSSVLLAAFRPNAPGVEEDYRLAPGSVALGAGWNGADAGPFGSNDPGPPGRASAIAQPLFQAIDTSPPLSSPIGQSESVQVEFSAVLAPASANAATVRVTRGGVLLSITLQTIGATLLVAPPPAGWGAGDFQVEIDGLTASNGTPLPGALVLPFSP